VCLAKSYTIARSCHHLCDVSTVCPPCRYYYHAFLSWVGNYTYGAPVAVPGAPATVQALCFTGLAGAMGVAGRAAIVIWSTTSSAAIIPNVAVPVTGALCNVAQGAASVKLMTPADTLIYGTTSAVPVSNGAAAITVTELPVVLLYSLSMPA